MVEVQEPAGVSPQQALRQALDALQTGRHDPRLAEGAQANALESIAWSLIGILQQSAKDEGHAVPADPSRRSLSQELQKAGFLQIDRL